MRQNADSPAYSQEYSFTGSPAALGCSPLGRKLCVPAFRQVCHYSVEKSGPRTVGGQASVDRISKIITLAMLRLKICHKIRHTETAQTWQYCVSVSAKHLHRSCIIL